ncbi:S-adenosyl-L-methionine-dependent methyltransferase [Amylocarpus encephaloides]|uniref:S-adenosyl-L-methionine-dependent methyltransferase n=1 Tax=Amylocarpus encephaloides TaxID=45428 RepID=A0A9P7YFN8_9HELO|nr:S-adenosyl-L-methionine-dependent methyltransferase [Amylocarpus encephaloides]
MFEHARNVAYHLIDPIHFMAIAACYLPGTIASLLLNLQFRTILTPSALKDAWFARFWEVYGPLNRINATENVRPLITQAKGIVLDIGPGTGEWVSLFDKENITRIYGVEPNVDHHPRLKEKITEAGLQDKYVIVPLGIQDLGEKWVKRGTVDSVVTIQCLCSIPRPREMIEDLYGYIKEGGNWVLYEHVKVKEGRWVGSYQSLINIIWPHFLGGCSLTRDIENWLKVTGSWSKVDLFQPIAEPEYQVIPHLKGVLVK